MSSTTEVVANSSGTASSAQPSIRPAGRSTVRTHAALANSATPTSQVTSTQPPALYPAAEADWNRNTTSPRTNQPSPAASSHQVLPTRQPIAASAPSSSRSSSRSPTG